MHHWKKDEVIKKCKEAFNKIDGKLTMKNYLNFKKGKKYPSITTIKKYFNTWNEFKKTIMEEPELYKDKTRKWKKEDAIKAIIKLTDKMDRVLVTDYINLSQEKVEYPSFNIIQKFWGTWNNMKKELFDDMEIYDEKVPFVEITKDNFCKYCGIGRCRFNYNLDECEYYEGE